MILSIFEFDYSFSTRKNSITWCDKVLHLIQMSFFFWLSLFLPKNSYFLLVFFCDGFVVIQLKVAPDTDLGRIK